MKNVKRCNSAALESPQVSYSGLRIIIIKNKVPSSCLFQEGHPIKSQVIDPPSSTHSATSFSTLRSLLQADLRKLMSGFSVGDWKKMRKKPTLSNYIMKHIHFALLSHLLYPQHYKKLLKEESTIPVFGMLPIPYLFSPIVNLQHLRGEIFLILPWDARKMLPRKHAYSSKQEPLHQLGGM